MAAIATESGHSSKQSTSTRNPHNAKPSGSHASSKKLAKLSFEERVLEQWRLAYGAPLSDEAKAHFTINCCDHVFPLGDVRLWLEHHPPRSGGKEVKEKGKLHLEFFFDGSPTELEGRDDVFVKAFEDLVERQLQECRVTEFRQKLAARRRPRGTRRSVESPEDGEAGGAGEVCDDDGSWKEYLATPPPATELSVRSLREAGCMIRFLVCQTSLSVSAAEALGQNAFPEQFPIDGVEQEVRESTKPLPGWFYSFMAFGVFLLVITCIAWWQVLKPFFGFGPDSPRALM